MVQNISPKELERKIKGEEDFLLLDIRELYELEICKIPGATHIRMSEIPNRLNEIEVNKDIVVYCHLGVRSLNVVEFLMNKGMSRFINIQGGIDLYARECDTEMQRY